MPSPLSVDLRVVAAVAEGASFHRAAARFGVSVSSASRWSARFAQKGHVVPKPTRGNDRLPAIEAQADRILSTYEARPDFFLRELRDALAAQGAVQGEQFDTLRQERDLWAKRAELLATVISHEAHEVIGNSTSKEMNASTSQAQSPSPPSIRSSPDR